jgi:crotonobetaine/carnitine-CoA ligase
VSGEVDTSEPRPGLAASLVLPQLIHARGRSADGDRPFLKEVGGAWLSYGDIDRAARRWAHGLSETGVEAGDRVAVILPTSIASMLAWLACGWLRAFEVPIHVEYRGPILRHVLSNSGAKVLVIGERFIEILADMPADLALTQIVVVPDEGGSEDWRGQLPAAWRDRTVSIGEIANTERPAEDGPSARDTGAIVYTSGTTGAPKGVMVPWRQFYKHGEIFFPVADVGPDETFYCPLPLSHIAGRVGIYNRALAGGRAVLREKFSIEAFWADVEENDCTCALLIGSIAEMLWRRPPSEADGSSKLRYVLMGPLIPQVEAFKERFNLKVRSQFGMTETTAPLVSGIRDDWDLANADSCGRVTPGFHCRVADENDEPVGPGVVGELLVRSDDPWLVMSGYWADAESTAEAFRNQWFHTGDAFRYDEEGNFYFVDRIKDTIRRRGENISSFMVEQTIAEHPDIADCAVVGVASDFTEQEIHAFVVARSGEALDPDEIRRFLDGRLPAFMVPRFWSFVGRLPRTPTQRVRKVELRQWVAAEGKRA